MLHLILYLIAITSLSTSASLIRLAGAPVEVIGFWRLAASALFLLPFALRTGNLKDHIMKPKKELLMVLLSALFFFAHLWTYFYSAQNTRIANCMIIFSINPLFVSLGSYLVFKERLTLRLLFAYIFAAFGIYNLVSHSLSFEAGFVKGDLAALVSAALFSGYLITGKKARMTLPNSDYTFIAYLITAILFGGSALAQSANFTDYGSMTWLAILLSVVFPTLMGHVLFSYLMKRMNLNFMSCGKLLEPALSAVMAYLIFHEELTASAIWAFAFAALAVLILFLPVGNLAFIKATVIKKVS